MIADLEPYVTWVKPDNYTGQANDTGTEIKVSHQRSSKLSVKGLLWHGTDGLGWRVIIFDRFYCTRLQFCFFVMCSSSPIGRVSPSFNSGQLSTARPKCIMNGNNTKTLKGQERLCNRSRNLLTATEFVNM